MTNLQNETKIQTERVHEWGEQEKETHLKLKVYLVISLYQALE